MDKKLTISKSKAKRNYLLTDEDLQGLLFSESENPVRKGFTSMKIFSLEDVEKVALGKWGTLEKIDEEKKKRETVQVVQNNKNSELLCKNLRADIVFDEMEKFMAGLVLPDTTDNEHVISPYFLSKEKPCVQVIPKGSYDDLCESSFIITYYDCMNREIPEGPSWCIKKRFPSLHNQVKRTPFNERRKLGHFCWAISDDKGTVVFAVFATNKWIKRTNSRIPPIEYAALEIAVNRIAKSLDDLNRDGGGIMRRFSLGTFLPFKTDEKTVSEIFEKLPIDVKIYCHCKKQME